jgi:hypothetical protein
MLNRPEYIIKNFYYQNQSLFEKKSQVEEIGERQEVFIPEFDVDLEF